MRDHLRARAVADDAALVDPEHAVAELRDGLDLVRHEDDRAARRVDVLHPPEAARLELGVAHAQNLVHEHDLGLEVRRDREGKPDVHAARVALHRRVEELLHSRELCDLRQLGLDLAALHAEDRAVQEDVLPARELGMEAGPDLEQAADAAADRGSALGRSRDAGEDLEQRRLAGAVSPDDPERLAFLEVERDVPESPDLLVSAPMLLPGEPLADVRHRLAQRPVRGLELAYPVALGETLDGDRGRGIRWCPRTSARRSGRSRGRRRTRRVRPRRRRPSAPGRACSRRASPISSPRSPRSSG